MEGNLDRQNKADSAIYAEIIKEAKAKAAELKPKLPPLPTEEELEPIIGKMYALDKDLINQAKRHLDYRGSGHGHGFEHLEWVAVNGAYVAGKECDERGITGELREEIIRRAWRLGLMHDLERWRGYQNIHAIEGMIAAKQKLKELGIEDDILLNQVLLHDNINVSPRNDPRFDIPFFSDFAVDHLNWGDEFREVRWRGLAKKNVPVNEAIHDYHFMEVAFKSPNFQQTKFGREVAIPYIQFGIDIAKHIENKFSVK